MNFRKGYTYICTSSHSPGYKVGNEYFCYLNDKGQLCLKGDDGYEDLVSNLVSKFKKKSDGVLNHD